MPSGPVKLIEFYRWGWIGWDESEVIGLLRAPSVLITTQRGFAKKML